MKIFRIDPKQKGGFKTKAMPFLLMSPGIRKGENKMISQRIGDHAFAFSYSYFVFLQMLAPDLKCPHANF